MARVTFVFSSNLPSANSTRKGLDWKKMLSPVHSISDFFIANHYLKMGVR